jgi:hypothetical protein
MVLSLAFFIPSIISWLNERLERGNLSIGKRLIRYTIHMRDNFPTRRRRRRLLAGFRQKHDNSQKRRLLL